MNHSGQNWIRYRVILLLLFVCSGQIQANAQNIFYSRQEKFSFQNSDFDVIGRSGDHIYTYCASKEGYFLNAYNDSMRMTAKVALDFFPQKIAQTEFINYPDGMLVFYQVPQSNQIVQYVARLDERAMLIGKPMALDSVKTGWFSGTRSVYSLTVSEDKHKIMIFGLGKSKLITLLLDKDLQVLGRGRNDLSKETGDMNMLLSLLDDSGRFYITFGHEDGSRNYNNLFRVYAVSPDGSRLVAKDFPMQGKYLSGIYSKLNFSNHDLYSAAFYSSKKTGNLEGVFYFVFDPANEGFPIQKIIPFQQEVKEDTDIKNKKKALNDFEVRKLILKNGGGFLLISENAYVITRTTITPGFGYYSWYYNPAYNDRSIREYHFGDILALDFNENGDLLWHRFIRKAQYSQEDGGLFSSYGMLNSGASLVFLFNNFSSNKSSVDIAALDAEGGLQVQKFYTGSRGGDWIPRYALQTSNKEWIVPVLNRNNLFFARIVF